ncbi:hypothetical protein G5716_29390 [Bacillus pacificus]|nr:hypothetical protein [Bacillus pacificus]
MFSNKNIHNLFPHLKEVDFYSYDSNSVKIKAIHPHEKNISIPYVVILDLDQILDYNKEKYQFIIKKADKFTNPIKDKKIGEKELFYYGENEKEHIIIGNEYKELQIKVSFTLMKNGAILKGHRIILIY